MSIEPTICPACEQPITAADIIVRPDGLPMHQRCYGVLLRMFVDPANKHRTAGEFIELVRRELTTVVRLRSWTDAGEEA